MPRFALILATALTHDFSCKVAGNSCRSRIELYFCDLAHNKLHRVTPQRILLHRVSSPFFLLYVVIRIYIM